MCGCVEVGGEGLVGLTSRSRAFSVPVSTSSFVSSVSLLFLVCKNRQFSKSLFRPRWWVGGGGGRGGGGRGKGVRSLHPGFSPILLSTPSLEASASFHLKHNGKYSRQCCKTLFFLLRKLFPLWDSRLPLFLLLRPSGEFLLRYKILFRDFFKGIVRNTICDIKSSEIGYNYV